MFTRQKSRSSVIWTNIFRTLIESSKKWSNSASNSPRNGYRILINSKSTINYGRIRHWAESEILPGTSLWSSNVSPVTSAPRGVLMTSAPHRPRLLIGRWSSTMNFFVMQIDSIWPRNRRRANVGQSVVNDLPSINGHRTKLTIFWLRISSNGLPRTNTKSKLNNSINSQSSILFEEISLYI